MEKNQNETGMTLSRRRSEVIHCSRNLMEKKLCPTNPIASHSWSSFIIALSRDQAGRLPLDTVHAANRVACVARPARSHPRPRRCRNGGDGGASSGSSGDREGHRGRDGGRRGATGGSDAGGGRPAPPPHGSRASRGASG